MDRVLRREERDGFADRVDRDLDGLLAVGRVGRRVFENDVGGDVGPERKWVRQVRTVGDGAPVLGAVGTDPRERAGPAGAGLLGQLAVDDLLDRLPRLARAAG